MTALARQTMADSPWARLLLLWALALTIVSFAQLGLPTRLPGALEPVVQVGSAAQWGLALVALLANVAAGMAWRMGGGRAGGHAPADPLGSERTFRGGATHATPGVGSHSIKVTEQRPAAAASSSGGLLRRLRRLLKRPPQESAGRCPHARAECEAGFTRKRSFGSRSSKSEDVLSSRFSAESSVRGQQGAAAASGRRGLFQRKASAGSRWQPSISRIASGQYLSGLAPSESSYSSAFCAAAGKRLEILSHNGYGACDVLNHELTNPAYSSVRQVITDTHLLQFGSLLGEASAELALSQAGSPPAIGDSPSCLFGMYDRAEYGKGWELITEEHKPGCSYWAWRRYLRKGLYAYKHKTLYENAKIPDIIGFTFDHEYRRTWDDAAVAQLAIAPPPALEPSASAMSLAEAEAASENGASAFMFARTKFPPPMASREYTFVRRTWSKPDDGGVYVISKACAHPSPPPSVGRTVRVNDYASGYVIRATKGVYDTTNPAVEVVNVYFEDPGVPSGIVNMSVRRALWPMVCKAEAAFRDYVLAKVHGGLERPPPEPTVALDSLGAAMGAGGAQAAARAAAAAAEADAASCVDALPGSWSRRWPMLGSPVMLLYRVYMGLYGCVRGVLLSVLSCLMSLWSNATALAVLAISAGRQAVEAVIQARIAERILWPWEYPLGRAFRRAALPGTELQRTASCGDGSSKVCSHPLPAGATAGPKKLAFALQLNSSNGRVISSKPPRQRVGFFRRCTALAVKVVKVAGAGVLLGRAARPE